MVYLFVHYIYNFKYYILNIKTTGQPIQKCAIHIVVNLFHILNMMWLSTYSMHVTKGLKRKMSLFYSGSQLAKMKKYIPHMSLPWNL